MDENRLKFVDASQLPTGRVAKGKWQVIFDKIPSGKALVFEEEEASFVAVRCALYALQSQGLFKNLSARKIKDKDGKYRLYVVNNNAAKLSK